MQVRIASLALALLAPALCAQGTQWVTNGDFTGTLAPWVMGGGYSVNPGLETGIDTTGFGPSDSFGVGAGGQVTPAPYPPNTLEQTVLMVQGLTYEFRCDAMGSRPLNNTVSNADMGTIWVEVDNVEVARHAFGGYQAPSQVKRAQVCGRFSPATTGNVTLRINFQRAYLANSNTPRMNIDNVSIKDVTSATFCIAGNRQLGGTVSHRVSGTPGAFFGTFVALADFPAGVTFPGILGTLYLDPIGAVTMQLGSLDANGESSTPMSIPNDPLFLQYPLFYQPGMWDQVPSLGEYFGVFASQ